MDLFLLSESPLTYRRYWYAERRSQKWAYSASYYGNIPVGGSLRKWLPRCALMLSSPFQARSPACSGSVVSKRSIEITPLALSVVHQIVDIVMSLQTRKDKGPGRALSSVRIEAFFILRRFHQILSQRSNLSSTFYAPHILNLSPIYSSASALQQLYRQISTQSLRSCTIFTFPLRYGTTWLPQRIYKGPRKFFRKLAPNTPGPHRLHK